MDYPVLIKIHSVAHRDDANESEGIDLIVSGTLSFSDSVIVIRYEEQLDENAPAEEVRITVNEDWVTMNRSGDIVTQMAFRMGSRAEGFYHTPFGDMALATYCTALSYDLNEEGGSLQMVYQLDLNGQFAAVHEMTLTLTRRSDD